MLKILFFCIIGYCLFSLPLISLDSDISDIKLGGLIYLHYEGYLDSNGLGVNKFKVSRAYLNVKTKIYDFLSFRMTFDIYDDDDGVEERLKYLFAQFDLQDISIISRPKIKFGIVHTPWIDFEEHITLFRMQGTMFLERQKVMNSSDFGLCLEGNIGGEMSNEYKESVNNHYAGKFGSFSLGVFNGGGYHNFENNSNKVLEGRLTLRPLSNIIPGFQLSYFGIYGKSNILNKNQDSPEWQTNMLTLSFENSSFTLLGQYLTGRGDRMGTLIDTTNSSSYNYSGFSLFGLAKIFENWRVWGRYDSFKPSLKQLNDNSQRMIIAVGYDFGNQNILLIDYDWLKFRSENTNVIKLTMQMNFEYALDFTKKVKH